MQIIWSQTEIHLSPIDNIKQFILSIIIDKQGKGFLKIDYDREILTYEISCWSRAGPERYAIIRLQQEIGNPTVWPIRQSWFVYMFFYSPAHLLPTVSRYRIIMACPKAGLGIAPRHTAKAFAIRTHTENGYCFIPLLGNGQSGSMCKPHCTKIDKN